MQPTRRVYEHFAAGVGAVSTFALGEGVARKVVAVWAQESATRVIQNPTFNGQPMTVFYSQAVAEESVLAAFYDVPDALTADDYELFVEVVEGELTNFAVSAVAWQVDGGELGEPVFDPDSGASGASPAIAASASMGLMTAGISGSGSSDMVVASAEVTLNAQGAYLGRTTWTVTGTEGEADASETVTAAYSAGSSGVHAILIGVAEATASTPTAPTESLEDIAEAGDSFTTNVVTASLSVHDAWTEGSEHAEGFSTLELFESDDEGASGGDEWTAEIARVQVADAYSHTEGSLSGDSWETVVSTLQEWEEGASAGDAQGSQQFPPLASTGAKKMHFRTGLGI